uniref:glycine dehydrogenase (aminomethyl-transferring) n=1 Tax=mine drainage metagenome TaxID=410659 RepID=E6QR26_9ZZZZ
MPFIPHTPAEVAAMLEMIGAPDLDALFDEIPADLIGLPDAALPVALNEMEITRLMHDRAAQDGRWLNFIGAGGYEHHIPAAVWQIVTRGEYYSAYTPYQAEASQGSLQLIYEYQTMMASLTGLDVSNASMYDGASALAEAVLMAVRAHKLSSRVLIPKTVSPIYRATVKTIVAHQGIEVVELPYDAVTGTTPVPQDEGAFAALVIPQPNFFGQLEDVDGLTDWAHARGAKVIALVNPMTLGVLKPPGQWGVKDVSGAHDGADIATGEGQPLGAPLSSGGPWYGFLTCRTALVRQMPGRLVGRTRDADGNAGYTLTLQAREQHIRRAKATSNICSNQGLVLAASTVFMSLLGPEGLRRVASTCHANTRALTTALSALPGVCRLFSGSSFHESVVQLDRPAAQVLKGLMQAGILGGYDLSQDYPELGHALLLCATETKTAADLMHYTEQLAGILSVEQAA